MTVSKMEIVRQESCRKAHRRTLGGDAVQLLPQKPDFEPIEIELEHAAAAARNATTAADGGPALDARLERESVWLDAHQMAEFFGRDRMVIIRHIRNATPLGNCSGKQPVQKKHRLPSP